MDLQLVYFLRLHHAEKMMRRNILIVSFESELQTGFPNIPHLCLKVGTFLNDSSVFIIQKKYNDLPYNEHIYTQVENVMQVCFLSINA